MNKFIKFILVLVPFMLLSEMASAADAAAQAAEIAKVSAPASGLLKLFQTNAAEWGPRLTQYATYLLFSLGLLQLVWTFSLKALDGNLELGGVVADLIRFIMFMGFFMAMIQYFPSWGGMVVDSFRKAAGVATGLGKDVTPSEMFWVAVSFAWRIVKEISAFGFGTAVITAIMAVIVLLCFTFISCFMFATLVESFIVINAAVLFMGFGGSSWTREFAIAPLKYLISVGAKLFVLTLIVGIIIKSSNDWLKAYNGDMTSLMTLGGMAFICAYMTKTIPELVAGMISGASMGGGGAIGSLAVAGAAGAAGLAAGAAMGAGAAANGAGSLANSISSSLSGSAPSPQTGAGDAPKIKPASSTGGNGGGSTSPKAPSSSAGSASKATGAAMRVAGSMAAISVPGMESASSLGNISSAPSNGFEDTPQQEENGKDAAGENSNIIRPAKPDPEK